MATTTKITGASSANNFGFYAKVIVGDFNSSTQKFPVTVDLYLVNNGTRTSSGGWTKSITCDGVTKSSSSQTIDTTGVAASGGTTKVYTQSFNVSIKSTINVSAYLSKTSYTQYDPGRCSLNGSISMPKVASTWKQPVISIPNIEEEFELSINKYVSTYYNVAEVRNSNNTILVKTINNANDGDNVIFTSSELNTIYTMDNNATSPPPLNFYIDLKTYTNSSKTTQVGSTQRLMCEAFIINGEPTATYTIVEQDANVIALLGSDTSDYVIENASDLLFTITPTAQKGATISSVKVNDTNATYDEDNHVYTANITNIPASTNIFVQDSRGLGVVYQISKTVLNYIPININSWSIKRVSQTSSNLVLNADITCYSSSIYGSANTPTVQYSIDGITWSTISSSDYTFADNKITITNLTLSNLISHQVSGTFYLKITDLLTTAPDNKTVSVGIYTFAKSDRKVRINGTLELADSNAQNRFEIRDRIIVESGSNADGNYIKYGDGTMICYNTFTVTTAVTTSWGNLKVSSKQTGENYPEQFSTIKSINMNVITGPTAWIGTGETGTTLSTTKMPDYFLITGVSSSSTNYLISYVAIGTWE